MRQYIKEEWGTLDIKYHRHASKIRALFKGTRKLWKHTGAAVVPFGVLAGLLLGGGMWFVGAVSSNHLSPFIFEIPFLKVPVVVAPPTVMPQADQHAYGFSAGDLVDLNITQLNARLDDFKRVGMTWVRVDMPWSVVQAAGPMSYNWPSYDRVFDALQQHGLSALVVLDYTPPWARQANCKDTERCPPADYKQFAQYAATATARYKAKVQHWEIWNEPNDAKFWGSTADAAAYTKLLVVASEAIKKQDPAAFIITGGLAPAFTEGGSIAPVTFLTSMYNNGAKGSFDAVGDHAYSYPASPIQEVAWSGWIQMRNLRPVMADNGDYNKTIWITEYGAPTNGPGPGATRADYNFDNAPDHVDEPLQADMARQSVALYKTYSWVGPMFWYGYKDMGTDTSNNELFFGLLRNDGSRKAAYAALQQAIKQ